MMAYYICPIMYDGEPRLNIFFGKDDVNAPREENMVKVYGGKVGVTKNFGATWDEIKMDESDNDIKLNIPDVETKPEKKEDVTIPDEPIDVASMLINATITVEPSKFGTLSPLHDKEPQTFAKYDTNQLREIAEHLLVYCDAQERGCADACCENCEP